MAIPTGERSFHKVQIGVESTEATGVAATFLFPAESAGIIELDRAARMPEEDYGELAAVQPGRSVFGVRQATMPLRGDIRYEDFMRLLQSAIAGGVTPTGTNPYTWTYTMDNSADTLKSLSIEDGDNIQAYLMVGAFVQRLRLSFDALAPGQAAPWQFEATLIGRNKTPTTFTGSVTAPANMETAMGHLTRLYFGAVATAYASLSEVAAALLAFDLTIETGIVLRKQGGTTDAADSHGRGKVSATFTMLLEQIAAAKTGFFDIFASNALDPVIASKRMRIKALGASPKAMTIDGQVEIEQVPVQEGDGSTRYSVQGHYVKDATLAGLLQIVLVNAIAT